MAGGFNRENWRDALHSTELLNMNKTHPSWSPGPDLPFPIRGGSMISFGNAVIYVSGSLEYKDTKLVETNLEDGYLYKLTPSDPDAKWQKMQKKLKRARKYHVAFLIPDHYAKCY